MRVHPVGLRVFYKTHAITISLRRGVKAVTIKKPGPEVMSGVVRWFKSGKAVLTKFKPLTEDAAEDEDDQEMVVLPTETKQQGDLCRV